MIQIIIDGDIATGQVKISGPIDDMRVVHWMLEEGKRVCVQRANERDKAAANGGLTLVRELPPGLPPV